MKNDNANTLISIIIAIIILIGIVYGAHYFIMGRDGIVTKLSNVENEFDKTEVLENLTEKVKQKYMSIYNEAKGAPDKKLEEMYNTDIAIASLVEQGAMEYYYYSNYDEKTNKYNYISAAEITQDTPKRDDIFWINTDVMSDVKTFGKGSKFSEDGNINNIDVFLLEKNVENDKNIYIVKYYDMNGNKKDVGILELAEPLIK